MWGISYWVFPVISALCWLGMLLGLLISWNVDGKPQYASMDPTQDIAYISDVGAAHLKPLFIAGACVTTIFLDLAFISERWLRHTGRLARNTTVTEKILSGLSMIAAIVGTCGLILLSIFDTAHYPRTHNIMLALFIGGYVISAVFICWEYQRLGIHFREHAVLRRSFWIKLVFIFVELGLAIGFGVCNLKDEYDAAAVLEWAIAFIFTFYVLSFFVDLYPAVHTKNRKFATAETEMQREANDGMSDARVYNGNRNTVDSERTLTNPHLDNVERPKPAVARNF
ncbi:frag1 dram sfk1 family protein [Phlyctema vagabunda]|uniref:Frag1 dram sfk1 family protein n=1 Tax=Phlyctema vagabunda TaxID=108571 RepID=A0ABR4PY73_9HELO